MQFPPAGIWPPELSDGGEPAFSSFFDISIYLLLNEDLFSIDFHILLENNDLIINCNCKSPLFCLDHGTFGGAAVEYRDY